MATAWKVALGIAVGGWFVTPLIAFYMPKVLAYLGFDIDTSTKFEHLQDVILQQLEDMLPLLDEARIVKRGNSPSELKRLNTMAASLRHAQEDAEDIDHDHQSIDRRISLDVFKNRFRSIIDWLDDSYEKACVLRVWSDQKACYTSKQGVLDCLITAIPRRNLMKRIEEVESTVNKVIESANPIISKSTKDVSSEKKSTPKVSSETKSTRGVSSEKKGTPDDIVKEKRTEINTVSNHNVFGLEVFRDTIMAKLRMTPESSNTSACYSSIGIHGLSGSGKTTFALYIRDHIKEECKGEDLFDITMCIHVSETFSVMKIFRNMLKDITNQENSNISDVEVEKKLKILLHGKRFFLILDDLWVEGKKDKMLQKLISPLQGGLKGSKILVTSQTGTPLHHVHLELVEPSCI